MSGARALLALAAAACLLPVGPVGASPVQALPGHDPGVTLLAKVPSPGFPDSVLALPDGSILTGTNRGPDTSGARQAAGSGLEPSVILRYSARGLLLSTLPVTGQQLDRDHGIMGMALDAQDRLYVVDYAPARVLRFDPTTWEQSTYATIPDLPRCAAPMTVSPCDNSGTDQPPWPVTLAFNRRGLLLVSDLAQGTIWQVEPGGGAATVWDQRPEYRSVFGPSQIAFDAAGRLLVDVTGAFGWTEPDQHPDDGSGLLLRVTVTPDGRPAGAQVLYNTLPGEAPDGFAVGRSGRVYLLTLTTNSVLVVDPDRGLVDRLTHASGDVPLDSPAAAGFYDGYLVVANLTFFTGDARHWALLKVPVDDRGLRPIRPSVSR